MNELVLGMTKCALVVSDQFHTKEQTIHWEGEDNSAFLIHSETAVLNVRKEVHLITGMSQWFSYGTTHDVTD